jgi:acetoin utilization protein AcuB
VVIVERPEERGDQPTFMGIVSQRDILRQTLPEKKQKGNDIIDPKALKQLLSVVVARKPISTSLDTPIPDVIETMINNRINILPVLDGSELAGIITSTDILRMYPTLDMHLRKLNPKIRKNMTFDEITPLCSEEAVKNFTTLLQPAEKIMTTEIMSLGPHDTLGWAVDILNAEQFRHILIADEEQKLLGIISDRDILKHLPFAGRRPNSMVSVFKEYLLTIKPNTINLSQPLEKLITTRVMHISPDTTCMEAVMTMMSRKINSLPVVDKDRHILGLITSTDLMRSLLNLYPDKNAGVQ